MGLMFFGGGKLYVGINVASKELVQKGKIFWNRQNKLYSQLEAPLVNGLNLDLVATHFNILALVVGQ